MMVEKDELLIRTLERDYMVTLLRTRFKKDT